MANKCSVCGAPLNNNTCDYCGNEEKSVSNMYSIDASMQQPQPVQQVIINNQTVQSATIIQGVSQKNKMIALLLCIFLGFLGAHRFYVGKYGTGILYFFTVGFYGIGWIVDAIFIALGAFKDGFGLPLKQ